MDLSLNGFVIKWICHVIKMDLSLHPICQSHFFQASPEESYVPFMPNVLKVFLENGQTKSFKYDNKTTVKVLHQQSFLASFLWDIDKHHSPRCDVAESGVPSGAILFAKRNFFEK